MQFSHSSLLSWIGPTFVVFCCYENSSGWAWFQPQYCCWAALWKHMHAFFFKITSPCCWFWEELCVGVLGGEGGVRVIARIDQVGILHFAVINTQGRSHSSFVLRAFLLSLVIVIEKCANIAKHESWRWKVLKSPKAIREKLIFCLMAVRMKNTCRLVGNKGWKSRKTVLLKRN